MRIIGIKMKQEIVKSFLKTSTAYLLFAQYLDANKSSFSKREFSFLEKMKSRMENNMMVLKKSKENNIPLQEKVLYELDAYTELVLQKMKNSLE